MITVPKMTPFTIPPNSTIESLKPGIPMSDWCDENLTTSNFGTEDVLHADLSGGFLPMLKNFSFEEAIKAVKRFTLLNPGFGPGTPLQALAYLKSGASHPNGWVVEGKVFRGNILRWGGLYNEPELRMYAQLESRDFKDEIFIVRKVLL